MSEIQYYCLDLETNGLKCNYHECTEIGIIRAKDKMQLWRNIKCDFPERSSMDALAITNKTLADLQNGYTREQVVEECEKLLNEDGLTPAHRCIVGHNIISFDKRFLFALWESVGRSFPAQLWLDTIPMTRSYAKQIGLVKPKVNLHAACDIVGLKKVAAKHNAKSDSQNSYLLWKNLVEQKGIDYLPFIKSFPHQYQDPEAALAALDSEEFDPSLLDIE